MTSTLPFETVAQFSNVTIPELEEILAYHGTDLETFSEDHDEQFSYANSEVTEWLEKRGL